MNIDLRVLAFDPTFQASWLLRLPVDLRECCIQNCSFLVHGLKIDRMKRTTSVVGVSIYTLVFFSSLLVVNVGRQSGRHVGRGDNFNILSHERFKQRLEV